MLKTTVIEIFGGPGSGKTSLLHKLMAYCKKNNIDAETSSEYVKKLIFNETKIYPTDQVEILAQQFKNERVLYDKTKYIITDCPIWLSIAYEKQYSKEPYVAKSIIEKYIAHYPHVERKRVLIKRPKVYNPSGRTQSEAEAIRFDNEYIQPLIKSEFKNDVPTFTTGKYKLEDIVRALNLK